MRERLSKERLLDLIRRRKTRAQNPDATKGTPRVDDRPTVVMQRVPAEGVTGRSHLGEVDQTAVLPKIPGGDPEDNAPTKELHLGGVDLPRISEVDTQVLYRGGTDDTVVIHVGNIGEEAFDTAMRHAEEEMRRVKNMTKDELDKAITEGNLFARFEQARHADRAALVPTTARTRQQDNETTTEDREGIVTLLTQKAMDGYLAVTIVKQADILTKKIDPNDLEAVFVSIGAHLGRFRRDKETLANLLLCLFNDPKSIKPTWEALVEARSSKEFEELLPIKLAEHFNKK